MLLIQKNLERLRKLADHPLQTIWYKLPENVRLSRPIRLCAGLIYSRARRRQLRVPEATYTRFFRNRPQLEVLAEIAARYERLEPLRLAVLGCSTGAELYSILYMLRLRRSDLELSAVGLDISEEVIAQAAKGEYGLQDREVERLSSVKREALCRQEGDHLYVHEWLRQGVQWIVADACDPNLSAIIGPQDIVVANNFLIHLSDELAERCLRSIISLVTPGGHLCVWGVNLDMRTRVVHERGLVPILSRIEEIHNADERAREVWPWLYWGLEPLDRARPDWQLRYVTIFQVQQSLKK